VALGRDHGVGVPANGDPNLRPDGQWWVVGIRPRVWTLPGWVAVKTGLVGGVLDR